MVDRSSVAFSDRLFGSRRVLWRKPETYVPEPPSDCFGRIVRHRRLYLHVLGPLRELEQVARSGRLDGAEQLFADVTREFDRIQKFLASPVALDLSAKVDKEFK
jgi:hypothetical protein